MSPAGLKEKLWISAIASTIALMIVPMYSATAQASTSLTLDWPPEQRSEGKILIFNGQLKKADGSPMFGTNVFIHGIAPDGEEYSLSGSITDSQGRYGIVWRVQDLPSPLKVFAYFPGGPGYAESRSSEHTLSISGGAASASGCLIATAAFGSEFAPQVQMLREIRDNQLLKTSSGSAFMSAFNSFYYSWSPTVAEWERQNPMFKEFVRITITPLITTLSILTHVSMDTEEEALGYGIGIILLNIGIYFVGPAFAILFARRKLMRRTE